MPDGLSGADAGRGRSRAWARDGEGIREGGAAAGPGKGAKSLLA